LPKNRAIVWTTKHTDCLNTKTHRLLKVTPTMHLFERRNTLFV
jgi:hypothetical protein